MIFSLDHEQWQRAHAILEATLGAITWFDPVGIKDIVLHSTGAAMPLLHAQFGPWALGNAKPGDSLSTRMLCLPVGDDLLSQLAQLHITPSATATILHRHCDGLNWRHLLTSDI